MKSFTSLKCSTLLLFLKNHDLSAPNDCETNYLLNILEFINYICYRYFPQVLVETKSRVNIGPALFRPLETHLQMNDALGVLEV